MRLSNVLNRFKKFLFLQRVETRSSIITFISKLRSCNYCKHHHLIELIFYFICFLFKHAVQRICFKISVCDLRSRRQSLWTHLIFQIIRDFDDESRRRYFLSAFVNTLSKAFYNINLRIFLLKLKTIFNKMFFLLQL